LREGRLPPQRSLSSRDQISAAALAVKNIRAAAGPFQHRSAHQFLNCREPIGELVATFVGLLQSVREAVLPDGILHVAVEY